MNAFGIAMGKGWGQQEESLFPLELHVEFEREQFPERRRCLAD